MNVITRLRIGGTLATMGLLLVGMLAVAADSSADLRRSSEHDYDAPAAGSYDLPIIKRAADGEVIDAQGRRLQLAEVTRGRVTVLSFIYTRCAAARACPYATGVLRQLHAASADDPRLAKALRLVSLSFDPANDSPERMAAYSTWAHQRGNGAPWHFLTAASKEKLQPILDAYGQAVSRKSNPTDPTGPLNHTLRVFLIDGEGKIRNIYSADTLDPRLVLADARTLMQEGAASK